MKYDFRGFIMTIIVDVKIIGMAGWSKHQFI